MKLTSNIKKLVIRKMSFDAVPIGGGVESAIEFLQKNNIAKSFKNSCQWAEDAISLIRSAKEPNPYKELSDEEIAGILLNKAADRGKYEMLRQTH